MHSLPPCLNLDAKCKFIFILLQNHTREGIEQVGWCKEMVMDFEISTAFLLVIYGTSKCVLFVYEYGGYMPLRVKFVFYN